MPKRLSDADILVELHGIVLRLARYEGATDFGGQTLSMARVMLATMMATLSARMPREAGVNLTLTISDGEGGEVDQGAGGAAAVDRLFSRRF